MQPNSAETTSDPAPSVRPKHKIWGVSPSQLDSFNRCPRVWFNQSVLKDREPSKPFQLRGEAIHKALEVYLQTGNVSPTISLPDPANKGQFVEFPTLEFIQVAIPFIPKPMTHDFWKSFEKDTAMLLLEQPGELATWSEGPAVTQYIDVVEALPKTARIIDYKTTSDFRYSKTPEELQQNTQLCWNAKYIFAISDYDEIEIEHLYLLTKGRPKAKPVTTRVTREQVEKIWARDMATVRRMIAYAAMADTADDLPPNTDSCDMYGGCYYRQKCGFDTSTVSIRRKTETMADKNYLLDQIMQQALKANPASETVKKVAAAMESPGGDLMAKLRGKAGPAAPAPAAAQGPVAVEGAFPGAVNAAQNLKDALAKKNGHAPAITSPVISPPDAPSPVSTAEEVAAANPPAAEPEPVKEDGPAPAKRGRRKAADAKVEATPAEVVPGGDFDLQASSPGFGEVLASNETLAKLLTENQNAPETQAEAPATALGNAEHLRSILTTPDPAFECGCEVLFVDCLPVKGWVGDPAVTLDEIMHGFERIAAQSAKKPDYRMISYESKGYLSLAIKAMMKGLPKTVVVDSRGPGADIFLSVVTPYVKMLFRGFRG